MPSCEKCWNEAYLMSMDGRNQTEHYSELIKENNCTPEEQAGEGAGLCTVCNRNTIHIYAKICMACGANYKLSQTPMTEQLKTTEIKVRISQTLKDRAFELAARQGIKLSELVRKLIEREVSK